MPRPSKAVRRQKINAGIEYKRGNRKEAYALWSKSAETRRELQAKKKRNQQGQAAEPEPKPEGSEEEAAKS